MPPARAGWLAATVDGWEGFWGSEVAAAVTEADLPIVYRLHDLKDLQAAAMARYDTEPYVEGSNGQPRANPALDDAMKLERSIVGLEDRLGLSPKARAQLGFALGQARLTASQLNEAARKAVERNMARATDDTTADPDTTDTSDDPLAGWEAAP